MSKASKLIEQYTKLTGKKLLEEVDLEQEPVKPEGEAAVTEEDDIKADGEVVETINAVPAEKASIAKIVEQGFSADNEKQMAAVEEMKKLAESNEVVANKFMEALDDVTSCMQVQEDADAEAMVVFEPEKWKALGEKYCKKG